jgi:hypothetical protein
MLLVANGGSSAAVSRLVFPECVDPAAIAVFSGRPVVQDQDSCSGHLPHYNAIQLLAGTV